VAGIASTLEAMAGYSGTPLPKKLGIKPESRLLVVAAPDGFVAAELAGLVPGVTVHTRPNGPAYDVVVVFVRTAAELLKRFEPLTRRITPAGRLWVAWPRKAGGYPSDVTENAIRDHAVDVGLVDNKVAAISEAWSGLQLVYRLRDRALKEPR
jgi:hypothetical protein